MSATDYKIALDSLRDYMAQGRRRIREGCEALDALPGYREALSQANASEEAQLRLVELTPQVAAIQSNYSGRSEERIAASERLVEIFARLDASDIRRLFRETKADEESWLAALLAYGFLTRAKNTQAVLPLIDRLKNPALTLPKPQFNSFAERLSFGVAKYVVPQFWEAKENYGNSVRCSTLRALGELQDRRAEAAIRPFLHDTDAKVREAAQTALSRLSEV